MDTTKKQVLKKLARSATANELDRLYSGDPWEEFFTALSTPATADVETVPMPQNVAQARAMTLLGHAWLEEHAPHELKASAPEPVALTDEEVDVQIEGALGHNWQKWHSVPTLRCVARHSAYRSAPVALTPATLAQAAGVKIQPILQAIEASTGHKVTANQTLSQDLIGFALHALAVAFAASMSAPVEAQAAPLTEREAFERFVSSSDEGYTTFQAFQAGIQYVREELALMDRRPDAGYALSQFRKYEAEAGFDIETPLERLRFFLSMALSPQDWLDVEEFLDALQNATERGLPDVTEEQITALMDRWSTEERGAYGGAHAADGEYLNMRGFIRDVWSEARDAFHLDPGHVVAGPRMGADAIRVLGGDGWCWDGEQWQRPPGEVQAAPENRKGAAVNCCFCGVSSSEKGRNYIATRDGAICEECHEIAARVFQDADPSKGEA